ncbi:signal transduction histidine kinase [Nocardia sp. GAS34]|uniref:sensor histidine kinase n=1 Tax=unclassified Nocardia TaxID=2637762 RepID=UPI003D1ED1F9
MHRSPLAPVFAALQASLHGLMVALTAYVVVRALVPGGEHRVPVLVLAVLFLLTYFGGAALRSRPTAARVWLGGLTVLWLGLVALQPEAVYLVFGLFFLYLHLLPRNWGLTAVVAATVISVVGFSAHRGWTAGGVIGPVLGAAVAVAIGMGYRALFREATERQRLIDELLATRATLAERERTAGKLAERERLAKEIHDTVAQGLSSIQMLLHAAEGVAPDHPARQQIRLARETAADNLAETRQLIAELTPAALEGQSLAGALERIAQRASAPGLDTRVLVEGEPERLPMPIEAALVRVAQGAVSNVVRHARAQRMRITLTYAEDGVHLDVVDDGIGIEPAVFARGTFGLNAMRSRVEQQGGSMDVETEPGHTAVTVSFPIPETGADADPAGSGDNASAATEHPMEAR